MSAELLVAASLAFSKSGSAASKNFPSAYFDVAGLAYIQNNVAVGITDESLALGDVATIGWVYAKNTDATNYITLSADGTLYNIKLKPGEFFMARWNGAAIHAKANTAPCNLEYLIISD